MPVRDEFDLDPVDEDERDRTSYEDLVEEHGVPYDEVFAAGPDGAREAVLRGDVPDQDEVRDSYWNALDEFLAEEQQRLQEDYTIREYLRHDADPATKLALLASAGVDSLREVVEGTEAEDVDEDDRLLAALGLRAANVGGVKGVRLRYRRHIRKETERYQEARDRIATYRPEPDDA